MRTNVTLLLLLLVSAFGFAQNDICGIDLRSGTRIGAYAPGEQVFVDFEYSIEEPGGARIFIQPFTNGSSTRNAGISPSSLYTGTGTAEANFTIDGAGPTVDEIQFLITNADQSATLREFYIPVHYEFYENGVHDFAFSADQEVASLLLGEQVNISFNYDIRHPGGAQLLIRPLTRGALTPGYTGSSSVLLNDTGSQTVNFAINSGINVRVDSLQVTIRNADQTRLIQEFFIPVNWYWSTVKVTEVELAGSPFAPNGENRMVEFDYATTEASGVLISPQPFTNGEVTPDFAGCASGVYTGNGGTDCGFTVSASNQRVDHLRFLAVNPGQTETLLDIMYPTNLYFGQLQIKDLVMCPPSPARLQYNENVNVHYTIDNQTATINLISLIPYTLGSFTDNYGVSQSPYSQPGEASTMNFFTVTTRDRFVDQVRFEVVTSDLNTVHAQYFHDVNYTFGDPMLTSAASPLAAGRINWKVFPNPLADHGQLTITPATSQTVSVRLIDLLGRQLAGWPSMKLAAGTATRIDLDRHRLHLPNGTYFLQLRGEDYVVTETVVVH